MFVFFSLTEHSLYIQVENYFFKNKKLQITKRNNIGIVLHFVIHFDPSGSHARFSVIVIVSSLQDIYNE